MRRSTRVLLLIALAVCAAGASARDGGKRKAIVLSEITWEQAEQVLTPDTVVVIPLGAQAKAHGPHLPLETDHVQAMYFAQRIAERYKVVMAPPVNYGFYPPFVEYPGSTTLALGHASGMIGDICRSLARFGARRFYVINIGLSTNRALERTAAELREDGVILGFTDMIAANQRIKSLITQEKGSHADEVETSVMLYIAPALVDMSKATKDYGTQKGAGIWPTRSQRPVNSLYTIFNPSGVYGDATAATRAKGKSLVNIMLSIISEDLAKVRGAQLPTPLVADLRFRSLVGTYEFAPQNTVSISIVGSVLVADRSGEPRMEFLHAGANRFEIGRTELAFLSDSNGTVTHLLWTGESAPILARRLD